MPVETRPSVQCRDKNSITEQKHEGSHQGSRETTAAGPGSVNASNLGYDITSSIDVQWYGMHLRHIAIHLPWSIQQSVVTEAALCWYLDIAPLSFANRWNEGPPDKSSFFQPWKPPLDGVIR